MSTELNINITGDGNNGPSDSAPNFDKETAGDAWFKLVGDNKEAMDALVKLGYTMSATAQASMQKSSGAATASSSSVGGATSTSDIQQEAKRRLDRIEREKAIDAQMRAMDMEYAYQSEQMDAEKQRRRELRYSSQQERDEDYVARQERLDEKRAEAELARQERQQERDEAAYDRWLRQGELIEQREIRERSKDISVVPEASALHDDDEYRRNVRAAMANRERSERQKEIRREMDPEFAQQEADNENKQRAQLLAQGGAAIGGTTGRLMGIASQVMGSPEAMRALGLGGGSGGAGAAGATAGAAGSGGAAAGAAGVAGAVGAAVPLVGIAMAVGEIIQQEFDAMGERRRQIVRAGVDGSKAVLSGDVDQRAEALVKDFDSLADGAKKTAPILSAVTEPAKEFVRGLNEMRGAVKQSAERMAQYNGQMAQQVAVQEVAELMRDINRANRNAGRMATANEARFNMEQKFQDIADRLLPLVLKVAEKSFGLLERFFSVVDEGIQMGLRVGDAIIAGIQQIIRFAMPFVDSPEILQEIRNMIRDMLAIGTTGGEDAGWQQFLGLRNPAGAPNTVTPLPPTPRPVVVAP